MKAFIQKTATLVVIVLTILVLVWQIETYKDIDDSGTQREAPISTDLFPGRNRYTNGTYSAVGHYISPAGREEVFISLTLTGDVITAIDFEGLATHPTSRTMQQLFAEGFYSLVAGQPIENLNLNVVNGSSLTPRGFNEALEKIRLEARS